MLQRKTSEAWIGGVCAGLADEYNLDLNILRLLWVLAFVFFGAGPIAYLIAWVLIPSDA